MVSVEGLASRFGWGLGLTITLGFGLTLNPIVSEAHDRETELMRRGTNANRSLHKKRNRSQG